MFESGMIWAPDEDFADEVIEECASFPYGDNDDLVDSTTQALMRFRQGRIYKTYPMTMKKTRYRKKIGNTTDGRS